MIIVLIIRIANEKYNYEISHNSLLFSNKT